MGQVRYTEYVAGQWDKYATLSVCSRTVGQVRYTEYVAGQWDKYATLSM